MKNLLHISGFIFLTYLTLLANPIAFESASDLGTTVKSETIVSPNVFATISSTDGLAMADLYDYGAPLSQTVIVYRDNGSNGTDNATITFSSPVDLISIYLFDGYSQNNNYSITPSPLGSNSIYNDVFNAYTGETVTLNFTNITSISIDVIGIPAIGIDNILLNSPTPVELHSFTGLISNNKVILNWATATEVNNYGFDIERSNEKTKDKWEIIGFVQGNGNSSSPKEYSFIDENPSEGNLKYRLKQIDTDGNFEYYATIIEMNYNITNVEDKLLIKEFALEQNYPNPFNPVTKIKYSIPYSGNVLIKIYNVPGNEIKTLVNEFRNAGSYEIEFDAKDLSSGTYFYQIMTKDFIQTKKMVLLR